MPWVCLALVIAGSELVSGAELPDFTKHVAPLLTKYCTGCHNDADREGKLSLESYASLLKGGEKGGVVTPGQADLSRLVRVLTGDAKPKMPPEGEEVPKPAEIEVLKAWIAAGAKGPSGASADPAMLVVPQVKLTAPAKPAINAIALSPKGDVLAIARHGEVELLPFPARKTLHKLTLRGSVNGVAFSQDGQLVVAAAGEPGLVGEARLFKVADGSLVKEFRGHKDSLYCARLSPDGKTLATGGYDSAIKLWEVASGKELRTLDAHNGAVFELAFRPDGQVLASASGDRTVKLWNPATGQRLDTLKESVKELYSLAFSPDGLRLAAAGVDNRIRVWQMTPDAKEGANPLLHSIFAHETPVLRIVWSTDGQTIASAGEDRLVKIWNADDMTIRQTLDKQSDWATGLAISAQGASLVVGRIDGSLGVYPLAAPSAATDKPLVQLAEVPPEIDYGPQPPLDKLSKVAETEPNDQPTQAIALPAPGIATGVISDASLSGPISDASQKRTSTLLRSVAKPTDEDLYRFTAQAGDQWLIETKAARMNSPLDTKVEVLDSNGLPVPRLLLRAVRDSAIEFRGMNGDQRGVRLANWEEMLLNEYVYLSGEVIKHYQQRRGPDGDANFFPENGSRIAFFDTSSRAHALGEPAYIVVPYAVGTPLPNNGLPVFTLAYENDDDAQRKLGKDSRLTFVAPRDGDYLVRVSDVRGFAGPDFKYELTIRRPQPDFKVTLSGANPTINAGSGKTFTVKAERIDNFMGPIRVDITGLPPGFMATSPLIIPAGLYEAQGVINALPDAPKPPEKDQPPTKVTATATIFGHERMIDVNNLGTLKLADKPKVIVHLELLASPSNPTAGTKPGPGPSEPTVVAASPGPGLVPAKENGTGFPTPLEITITPGGTAHCNLRIERHGFEDRVPFDIANLPHGIIVDDIGLSGILVREKETKRSFVLRAEPWVAEQSRTFHATAQVEGNQVSLPMVIRVKR